MQTAKKEKIDSLRKEILCLQGLDPQPINDQSVIKLGSILKNMPGQTFPTGAIHEFISATSEAAAATTGFLAALLPALLEGGRYGIYVSACRYIYPPALPSLGLNPGQIIFIDATKEKDILWSIEEALKCPSVGAVIGEVKELSFTASRRLQLAVENSKVTGFIHRQHVRKIQPTASVARWRIDSLSSQSIEGVPGVGYPAWTIELLKIRNGQPGRWQVEWINNTFRIKNKPVRKSSLSILKSHTA